MYLDKKAKLGPFQGNEDLIGMFVSLRPSLLAWEIKTDKKSKPLLPLTDKMEGKR